MKRSLRILLSGLSFMLTFAVTSDALAQFTSVFQNAKSAGKGNGEITLLYSGSRVSFDGESYKLFDNLGLMGAFGISDNAEIRVRYDRFGNFTDEFFGEYEINSLMFGPKFSTKSGIFAAYIPIGFFFAKSSEASWNADPTLILSIPLGERITINFSPHYTFFLEEGSGLADGILGLNLGLGINVGSNWVIRPEGGLSLPIAYDGSYHYFGLGVTRSFGKN